MTARSILIEEIKKQPLLTENTSCMIMGQCEVESVDFQELVESFKYSHATRLKDVFGKYFTTLEKAEEAIKRGEQYIANVAYGGRMGNGNCQTGDGWRYRGRGLLQITGKMNYAAMARLTGLNLINNPDLAADPLNAALLAIAFFTIRPILIKYSDQGNVFAASSIINLGQYNESTHKMPNAYPERLASYNKWLKSGTFKKDNA